MATRNSFTSQEWEILAKTPDAICLAMIAAQAGGAVEERNAFFEAWKISADQSFADNQLVLTLIRERDALGGDIAFEAQRSESFSALEAGATREAAMQFAAAPANCCAPRPARLILTLITSGCCFLRIALRNRPRQVVFLVSAVRPLPMPNVI